MINVLLAISKLNSLVGYLTTFYQQQISQNEVKCMAEEDVMICFKAVVGCIQKFSDWPPGARTANGTALCH
jgi:hypothetical protein